MPNDTGSEIIRDRSGEQGQIIARGETDDGASYVAVERADRSRVLVPAEAIQSSGDGRGLVIDDDFAAYRGLADVDKVSFTTTLPVIEEELVVDTRQVETGRVRVRTTVEERPEVIDVPIEKQRVEIERVAVNRPADGPVEPRYEGDTLVVPLVEERVIVRKELMITEELRIRRVVETEQHREEIMLRTEHADIDRIDD